MRYLLIIAMLLTLSGCYRNPVLGTGEWPRKGDTETRVVECWGNPNREVVSRRGKLWVYHRRGATWHLFFRSGRLRDATATR